MALNPGDLVFIGWDSDNDDVVFLTTAAIAAGEEIYFTDSEWNGTSFAPGEQVFKWTVPAGGIDAGTVVTVDMISRGDGGPSASFSIGTEPGVAPIGTVDYEQGGGALAQGNEQFWAVQNVVYDAGARALVPASPTEPINFINMIAQEEEGDPGGPVLTNTGLGPDTGTVTIDGDNDFMIFDPVLAIGSQSFNAPPEVLRDELLRLIGDETNWTTADGGGTQNPSGTGFDFNTGNLGGIPQPIGSENTIDIYFTGDRVAFWDSISSDGGETTIDPIFAFEPDDIVVVAINANGIQTGGRLDGEFDFNEVYINRITVFPASGAPFEIEFDGVIKVKESGGENQNTTEQGDSFFTTADSAEIPNGSGNDGKLAFSLDESFRDINGNLRATVIARQRTDLDTDNDGSLDVPPPAGNANQNFNINAITVEPFPCFVAGTLIDTPDGPRPVQTLQPGDLVMTKDNGAQAVRWVGRATVPAYGDNTAILIKAGALGAASDLRVSPQHRVLVSDWRAELFFGVSECLVAAKHLCDGDRIVPDRTTPLVEYVHLLFDDHELVRSEGLWSETYFPGSYALKDTVSATERELKRLFPDRFGQGAEDAAAVRPILKSYEARLLTGAAAEADSPQE
ncbi:MAG: Hint domain-containing protein [Dinoroseobacter sp.]|nr:Hint domain-containing protein [Dinoroseobacter sp.]